MRFWWGFGTGVGVSIFLLSCVAISVWLLQRSSPNTLTSPESMVEHAVEETIDLSVLSFPALSRREFTPGPIHLGKIIEETEDYTAYELVYEVDGFRVTGQANIPTGAGPFPVIVMLRGFVDPSIYQTGVGTWRAAAEFARAGYITLAPDFLGFGSSDMPKVDVFWERFHKPVQVLQLLASVENIELADSTAVGIWGHSNGGQIAFSVLEISGKSYPTTLWAPVSKGFPYSILYFTDEYDDGGLALRSQLANLEFLYDVREYSIDSYWEEIEAPIQIHQGGVDDAVPADWSSEIVTTLEDAEVEITYWYYPSADHNLRPDWNQVVARDIIFFDSYLK